MNTPEPLDDSAREYASDLLVTSWISDAGLWCEKNGFTSVGIWSTFLTYAEILPITKEYFWLWTIAELEAAMIKATPWETSKLRWIRENMSCVGSWYNSLLSIIKKSDLTLILKKKIMATIHKWFIDDTVLQVLNQ